MRYVIVLLTVMSVVLVAGWSSSEIPHVINFQGKATDARGMPLNGEYDLTLRIYDHETSGDLKWNEVHEAISISNGIFQIQLGSITVLDLSFDEEYWISIEMGSDGEMTPRTRLTSVGYAYKAEALVEEPVIPFYKSGFDIEYVDIRGVRISPGVIDVAGKMFTETAYFEGLRLEYMDPPQYKDWVHGSLVSDSTVYVYAYNASGDINFKFSDESPDLSDHLGNTEKRPLLYQKYPDTPDGLYYRCLGKIKVDSLGIIESVYPSDGRKAVSIFSKFGGDGKNDDIIIQENTDYSVLTEGTDKYDLQAKNLTIERGATLSIDTGWAYIGVKGRCVINGTISADGQGEDGGDEVSTGIGGGGCLGASANGIGGGSEAQIQGFDNTVTIYEDALLNTQRALDSCMSGAGGGGGANDRYAGGAGGGAGGHGGKGGGMTPLADRPGQSAKPTLENKIKTIIGGAADNSAYGISGILQAIKYRGAGGGGAAVDAGGEVGGDGGGVIYIECDELILTGMLTAEGLDGASNDDPRDGGSGGGGGGIVIVRARTITTNTGRVSVDAGVGGGSGSLSGDGGSGAPGFKMVVLVE